MLIAICDDSREYLNTIEKYFNSMESITFEYDVFESGEDLVNRYQNNSANYDAIFLDMEMKDLNGIETANLIRKLDRKVIIIFATSHTKYMQESFECSPFKFLIKPISYEDLKKTFDQICLKLKDEPQTFIFTENKNRIRLFCEDIILFESKLHCIWIYTKQEKYKIYKSLSNLELQLNNTTFVRVHKSFIINLNYVNEIKETDIVLYDYEIPIPLSRNYKKKLVDVFISLNERKFLI